MPSTLITEEVEKDQNEIGDSLMQMLNCWIPEDYSAKTICSDLDDYITL